MLCYFMSSVIISRPHSVKVKTFIALKTVKAVAFNGGNILQSLVILYNSPSQNTWHSHGFKMGN